MPATGVALYIAAASIICSAICTAADYDPANNKRDRLWQNELTDLPSDTSQDPFADKSKTRFRPSRWGDCSSSCGHGIRSRHVECVALQGLDYANVIRLPDYECEGQMKPLLFEPCEMPPCAGGGETTILPAYTSASSASSSYSFVDAVRKPEKPLSSPSEDDLQSVTDAAFGSVAMYPGSGGGGAGIYRWDYGNWTPCSASCLGGRQRSTLRCTDLSNGKREVSTSFCDAKQRPIELTRTCNKQACPPEWERTPFGDCSHKCGGGVRTRRVRCIRSVSRSKSPESTLILPEEMCLGESKPLDKEACGLIDCPAMWKVGKWTQCSVGCGPGEQRRSVTCEQRSALGITKVITPPDACASETGVERPPSVQLCNLGQCGDGVGGDERVSGNEVRSLPLYRWEQHAVEAGLRRMKDDSVASGREKGPTTSSPPIEQQHPAQHKLTLNVGGQASLYEGTSVKVKCPVKKGLDRGRIHWRLEGRRINNSAHVKVSSNGALRIFHARAEEAGVYSCWIGDSLQGNVTLRFKHRAGVTASNAPNTITTPSITTTTTPIDPVLLSVLKQSLQRMGEQRMYERIAALNDRSSLRVDYFVGNWSDCSQRECNRPDGAQVRMLKCQVHHASQTAPVDASVCERFGVLRPPASRSCLRPDCPRWESSDWTDCEESRCLRHSTALQRRAVQCIYTNGTEAEASLCDRKARPKVKKECSNVNCTAEWRASPWGKCSRSCGDGGVQMRLLRCVWRSTKKAAGRSCEAANRPPAIRMCEAKMPSCGGEGLLQGTASGDGKNWMGPSPPHTSAASSGPYSNYSSSAPKAIALLSEQRQEGGACDDQSRFCDILKLFHSCDQERIRRQCCYTCRLYTS